ncbi:alpha-xenorhabdolysin family binary toxin subunit B [Proteus hauseri]|uniref:alpha-xenorhabdolysin family binary toxin subunit B n=1 Tax=Proteus hauseri TaxID=183417 RepID=UPI0032D9EAA4
MSKINNHMDTKDKFEHHLFFNTVKKIRQLSAKLSRNSNELNDELTSIYIENNKTLDTIVNFSILMKSRLKQKLLTETINTIGEINNEILRKDFPPQISKKLENEKNIIENIFKEDIDESIDIINNHRHKINIKRNSLNGIILKDKINLLIINEEKSSIEISNKILIEKGKITNIKDKIDIITKGEDVINNESINDIFNVGIPSKETITTLNIDSSGKNILRMLIELLGEFFSQLDKGFTYQKIVETRHQLIDDYIAKIKNLTELENQKRVIIFTLTHYHSLTNIVLHLSSLTNQLALLDKYWLSLINQLTQLKNNISNTNNIISPHILFLDKFLHDY